MNVSDFNFQNTINRLVQVYGAKAFEGYRLDLIRQAIEGLEDREFSKIADHFIATTTKPPLPIDFKEAARREKFHRPRREQWQAEPYRPKCSKCDDVGVVRMIRAHEHLSVLGLCDCETGNRQPWRLPKATGRMGFHISAVPAEFFKPDIPYRGQPSTKDQAKVFELATARAIQGKVSLWREKIRVSEQFWANEGWCEGGENDPAS